MKKARCEMANEVNDDGWFIPQQLRRVYELPWEHCIIWSEVAYWGLSVAGGWTLRGKEMIAKNLGMTVETVETAFKELKKKGLMESGGVRGGGLLRALAPWTSEGVMEGVE